MLVGPQLSIWLAACLQSIRLRSKIVMYLPLVVSKNLHHKLAQGRTLSFGQYCGVYVPAVRCKLWLPREKINHRRDNLILLYIGAPRRAGQVSSTEQMS